MGLRHRLTPLVAAATLAVAAAGCKRKPKAVTSPPTPVDHLAPGELPIGTAKAFSLPLPLASKVVVAYGGDVHVVSTHSPDELVGFVRRHVTGGKTTSAPTMTKLEDVVVPAAPDKHLTIRIYPAKVGTGARSEMDVEDVSPAAVDPNTTVEDRWKKAGLAPDGKILDPQHLQ